MVIIIKQNGKTISVDSLNDQYNKFVRDKSRQFGLLLDTVGAFIEPWVWSDSYSDEKCLSLLKRLSIKIINLFLLEMRFTALWQL